ncbi:hypothetical protein D9615_000214 [Tricholomella constricta]|uniref:Uncharacterized protein n=1 Tax=Tricholomella constricta TaxID=117010 RepID=A0A8H5HQM2_9AGAR|nr:hypothetical protein D9615_000214 [Tricholomella constricta]
MMIQRLLATSLARTARPALQIPCLPNCPRYQRSFSSTPRAQIDNNLAAFTAAFQKTSVFKKLAGHPEAIKALEELTRTLQEAGVELTSGQVSPLKMAKLAMNSKFRQQIKRVSEEMKKADVDFASKEVMDEIMALKKAAEPPK